jgi:hypothetical protein
MVSEEQHNKDYEDFLALMYGQLEKILDKRPKNPVSKFAKK